MSVQRWLWPYRQLIRRLDEYVEQVGGPFQAQVAEAQSVVQHVQTGARPPFEGGLTPRLHRGPPEEEVNERQLVEGVEGESE